MIGNNTLLLNKATMQRALEVYFAHEVLTQDKAANLKVVGIKERPDAMFEVEISAPAT